MGSISPRTDEGVRRMRMKFRRSLEPYEMFYDMPDLGMVKWLRELRRRKLGLEILGLLIALAFAGFAIGMAIKLLA